MIIHSTTNLFALAHGLACTGAPRCTFCGAPAETAYSLPDSFTAHDVLACPGSGHICPGCLLATKATAGPSPDGKPWMWSWIITPAGAERHALCAMLGGERVRAGRAALLTACLHPPEPPYALVLCEAGRTHTLYRAAVHRGGPGATLTHDGRALRYQPRDLEARVRLCATVASLIGVKTARDCLEVPAGRWTAENTALVESWHALLGEPLTEAAACLFPDTPKESASS